ncbi:hypothetical protein [Crenothrix sp.]|uniref:hypothetical protein n=1 Tax=Crenothrix sp. TaxID=3100433 RepID=UPI00374D6208
MSKTIRKIKSSGILHAKKYTEIFQLTDRAARFSCYKAECRGFLPSQELSDAGRAKEMLVLKEIIH